MEIIGLKRHTVKLIPHQPKWKEIYDDSKKELLNLIGEHLVEVQHIGSTSIPEIAAKPIIDIAIGVERIDEIREIIPKLESKNYEYRGDSGKEGGHLFVKNIEFEIRTHHVHVVEINDEQWKNYLYFRDKLRQNKNLAKQYSKLKNELSELYSENRKLYTKSKNDFIKEILKRK